jgi:hypothetical protein
MKVFRGEFKKPTFGYRLFKYLFVGAATLLLPPKSFYRAREWYAERGLARVREKFVKRA